MCYLNKAEKETNRQRITVGETGNNAVITNDVYRLVPDSLGIVSLVASGSLSRAFYLCQQHVYCAPFSI